MCVGGWRAEELDTQLEVPVRQRGEDGSSLASASWTDPKLRVLGIGSSTSRISILHYKEAPPLKGIAIWEELLCVSAMSHDFHRALEIKGGRPGCSLTFYRGWRVVGELAWCFFFFFFFSLFPTFACRLR